MMIHRQLNPNISFVELGAEWALTKAEKNFDEKKYIEAYNNKPEKVKVEKKPRVSSATAYLGFLHAKSEEIKVYADRIAEWNKVKESLSEAELAKYKKISEDLKAEALKVPEKKASVKKEEVKVAPKEEAPKTPEKKKEEKKVPKAPKKEKKAKKVSSEEEDIEMN